MKHIAITFICLFFSVHSFAQSLLAQAKPADSDNWGYINPQGELVIQDQFTNCHAFTANGYAPIYDKKRKSFYFIDTNGKELETEVESFRLKNIFGFGTQGFTDDIVAVQVKKKWGYLNTKGALFIPATYDVAHAFSGGFATARKGGKWTILNKAGEEIAFSENVTDAKSFSEGLAPVRVGSNWGFASTDGSLPIKATFKSVGYFSNGLAWAKTPENTVGYIDKKGNWAIEPTLEAAKPFAANGLARVKKSGSWTFINKSGSSITLPNADSFGDFENGLAYYKLNGKVGFIDKTGSVVIDAVYDQVRSFKNGYAAVRQGDKWGFIDTRGNWAVKLSFAAVKDFEKTGK